MFSNQSSPVGNKVVSLTGFKEKKQFDKVKEDLSHSRSFFCKNESDKYPLVLVTMSPADIFDIISRITLSAKMAEGEEFFESMVYADYVAVLYQSETEDRDRDGIMEEINAMGELHILEVPSPWYSPGFMRKNIAEMHVESESVRWFFPEQKIFSRYFPSSMFEALVEEMN